MLTGLNILRGYRAAYVGCDGTWRSYFNGCDPTSYSVDARLGASCIVVTAIVVVLGLGAGPLGRAAGRGHRRHRRRGSGRTASACACARDGPRDETRRLADEIDAMLDRLAEGYEAQRRFASNASHELRTPLATQRALIEVSLVVGAHRRNSSQLLSRQLLATNERNERLVDGLLTLAETERGLMANTPLRLDRIVARRRRDAAADGEGTRRRDRRRPRPGRRSSARSRCSTGSPATCVQNAIKYNAPGGSVRVEVHAGRHV